jgi:hypothetical protein
MRHVEALDGNYTEFFNDWVFGQGYPIYQMIYRLKANNEVELEITQQQSDPSVSFFEMDLPVRVYGKGGKVANYRLRNSYDGQLFRFNPGFAADSVSFDPDRWICTANPVVLNAKEVPYDQQVRIYPNPVTDQLTIQLVLPEEGLDIRIFNQNGQLTFTGHTIYDSTRMQIPMGSWPKGVYTVEVTGRKAVRVVR